MDESGGRKHRVRRNQNDGMLVSDHISAPQAFPSCLTGRTKKLPVIPASPLYRFSGSCVWGKKRPPAVNVPESQAVAYGSSPTIAQLSFLMRRRPFFPDGKSRSGDGASESSRRCPQGRSEGRRTGETFHGVKRCGVAGTS